MELAGSSHGALVLLELSNNKAWESRPSFTFIVGTVMVTLMFLGVTCLFLCCYHWVKVLEEAAAAAPYAVHQQEASPPAMFSSSSSSSAPAVSSGGPEQHDSHKGAIIITVEQELPCRESPMVIMPGHELPTCIAVPRPYAPLLLLHPPPLQDSSSSSPLRHQAQQCLPPSTPV